MNTFLVVKDEEGILRPNAGIWRDGEAGQINAKNYALKYPEITIVKVELVELS